MVIRRVVARVQSLTRSQLRLSAAHDSRKNTLSDSHIDQQRSHQNMTLVGRDIVADCERIAAPYPVARKDKNKEPIVAAQLVLTAAADWFDDQYPTWRDDPAVLQPWIDSNLEFLRSEYGDMLANVQLHLDEQAPHIHAYIVPLADRRFVTNHPDGQRQTIKKTINFGAIFSDTKEICAEARRSGSSDDTKLGRLQTAYGAAMQPLGLERGIRKSTAKHVSPEDFREMLQTAHGPVPRPVPTKARSLEPVQRGDALSPEITHKNSLNQQRHKQVVAAYDKLEPYVSAVRAAALESDLLKQELERTQIELARSREAEHEAIMELRKNQDYMSSLRALTASAVRQKLEIEPAAHTAAMDALGQRKWNAVNYVIAANPGFNLDDAIRLLAQHFPAETPAAVAEREHEQAARIVAEVHDPEPANLVVRQPTKAETVKIGLIDRQLAALGAEGHRITLMHPNKPAINVGKGRGPDGEEQFYSKSSVQRLVPYLSARNADGYNIFVTPISKQRHYLLLDDVTDAGLIEMQAAGFKPALIQRSSPKSIQIVAVIEKIAEVSVGAVNALFRRLNQRWGDSKISGLVHPFRLAGFCNTKPKHRLENGLQPFVELVQTQGGVDHHATQEALAIDRTMTMEMQTGSAASRAPISITSARSEHDQQWRDWYARRVEYWGDKADLSKIDYAFAKALREAGFDREPAIALINNISPDLFARHPRTDQYLHSKTSGLWADETSGVSVDEEQSDEITLGQS